MLRCGQGNWLVNISIVYDHAIYMNAVYFHAFLNVRRYILVLIMALILTLLLQLAPQV